MGIEPYCKHLAGPLAATLGATPSATQSALPADTLATRTRHVLLPKIDGLIVK